MSRCARICVLLCLLAGCQGTSQVFDNPVVGPPPPRVNAPARVAVGPNSPETPHPTDDPQQFALLQYTASAKDSQEKTPVTGQPGAVAARVNGQPILVSEVLQPYAPQLAHFRAQVSAEEFERMQRNLVKRDLPHYIETAMLVNAVQSQLDADQKLKVQEQLDLIFDEQLREMMRLAEVQSVPELEAKLKAAGSSLAAEMQVTGETLAEIRNAFSDRALSAQYLRESVGTIRAPTRQELLAEYRRRKEEYSFPAQVKWQQLQISYAAHGGTENAILAMARARADLQAGMSFDEVVAKHGDGPLVQLGGHFDWTQPESVADADLRQALEQLKAGEMSGPIEGKSAYMLVKVTESKSARTTPFEEVQDELRKVISERKRQERLKSVVAEIKSKAVIETMFDGESPDGDRQGLPEAGGPSPTS